MYPEGRSARTRTDHGSGHPGQAPRRGGGDPIGSKRYEHTASREAYRVGLFDRKLATTSGEAAIRMSRPKWIRFTTAIIERCRGRETSVEEAMIEMYLAGASTRRIEDVSEILWGSSVSASTVSNLNEKAFAAVEEWKSRPLERAYPYVYIDGIYLKRSWGDSFESVAVMVAIGVDDDGCREALGCADGLAAPKECWRDFLSWLRGRGLHGVRMFSGDKVGGHDRVHRRGASRRGLPAVHGALLSQCSGQGPQVQVPAVVAKLKVVHAMESREASEAKAAEATTKLEQVGLWEATRVVCGGFAETLTCTRLPPAPTGAGSAPTTLSRGSTGRSGEGPGS